MKYTKLPWKNITGQENRIIMNYLGLLLHISGRISGLEIWANGGQKRRQRNLQP